jgi:hypothetical protein
MATFDCRLEILVVLAVVCNLADEDIPANHISEDVVINLY